MKKIKQLTPDQIARFPEWSEKWLKIGLSTERADWATAEAGVRGCYDTAKLKQPIIILRMGSPLAATLGGIYGVALSGSKKLHSQVESQVGSQVWSQVGSQVGRTVHQHRGGQYWAGWNSYVTYFRDVCGWENPSLAAFFFDEQLTHSCSWVWWHDLVCAISDRPHTICRNAQSQLHCESGPAIAYPDGWEIYALNGVRLSKELVMTPAEQLDPQLVTKEQNAEVRREIVRKIGVEILCQRLGSKVLDKHGDYELITLNLGDDRVRPYLKMRNPSIGVFHIEGVAPHIKTVQQAINWRAGDEQSNWKPEVLT